MEFRQLKTFITVATLMNFTKSAAVLGYSQSSITFQIKQLEQELSVQLFERLGKTITLTHEGETLLLYAKKIINLHDESKKVLIHSEILSGSVIVGASESLCSVRLPQLFKVFHERYPDVEIALNMVNYDESQKALRENQIDFAFTIDTGVHAADIIVDLELAEPVALIAAPFHPLVQNSMVCADDFMAHTVILAHKGCSYRDQFDQYLCATGAVPKSIMETGSIQAIKQLTISGLGITLLPRIAIEEDLISGRLVELNWAGFPTDLVTQMMHHKDKWISPALKAFADLAKEEMKPGPSCASIK